MENTKFIAAIKACIAKIATGGMALRVNRVDNPGALVDGANTQSARTLETMLELCIVQDSEGKPAIRLLEEKPYKVYSALISQAGTAAPTAKILESDFEPGALVWTRTTGGAYVLTTDALFALDKTAIFVGTNGFSLAVRAWGYWVDEDRVNFVVTDEGVADDNLLFDVPVEIRVYRA